MDNPYETTKSALEAFEKYGVDCLRYPLQTALTICCERRDLRNQRMARVLVGSELSKDFVVPWVTLENISKAFAQELKSHKNADSDGYGRVQLPHDRPQAWGMLLHWQVKGHLPSMRGEKLDGDGTFENDAQLLALQVDCWLLGEKYEIVDFQDVIMLEFLSALYRAGGVTLDLLVSALTATAPTSKLSKVMAEEAASWLNDGHAKEVLEKLGQCSSRDFSFGILHEAFEGSGDHSGRLLDPTWKDYMVGEGPGSQHWIHEWGMTCIGEEA